MFCREGDNKKNERSADVIRKTTINFSMYLYTRITSKFTYSKPYTPPHIHYIFKLIYTQ